MKKKTLKKSIKILSFAVLTAAVLGEFYLRHFQGFCDAPLYIESKKYEYIAAPNQDGKRFGNHYYYNAYSQRSKEPDSSKKKILGLGDSVLFGGVQSDQDSIATSLFTNEQSDYQMLNISAGSWGPDNCAAYLKEKGFFNAKEMFLVVSSHDAHDNMDFKPTVGVHQSYPDKQYHLALVELFDRYLKPRVFKYLIHKEDLDPDQQVLNGIGIQKNGKIFNPGFDELKSMSDSLSIRLIVYLHADKQECLNKEYNEQGQEIISWAEKNNIKLIKETDYDFDESDYRDGIHINNKGQRKLANIIKGIY
ncbi:hypothetical protein [Mangrovibacterium sp.]|uniref:hypothetical protein n=1 Tax=Mangrovibacterium sp. TaxID=1961364 RepID=UPI00356AEA29